MSYPIVLQVLVIAAFSAAEELPDSTDSSSPSLPSPSVNEEVGALNFTNCTQVASTVEQHSECLRSAIDDAIAKLKDGNSNLNIPPLDPLNQRCSVVIAVKNHTKHVKVNFTGTVLEGLSHTKVEKLVSSSKTSIDALFSARTPEVLVNGTYLVTEQSDPNLLQPAIFNGNFTLKAKNVIMSFTLKHNEIFLNDIDDEAELLHLSPPGNEDLVYKGEKEELHAIVKDGIFDLTILLAEGDYMDTIIKLLIGKPVAKYAQDAIMSILMDIIL